jgi:hypothetical protein
MEGSRWKKSLVGTSIIAFADPQPRATNANVADSKNSF